MYANGETEIKHANIKKLCWTTEYVYTCIIVVICMHICTYTYICIIYIQPHIYVTYKHVYNLIYFKILSMIVGLQVF